MTRTSAPPRSSDTDNELFAEKVMITTADLYRAGWATSSVVPSNIMTLHSIAWLPLLFSDRYFFPRRVPPSA